MVTSGTNRIKSAYMFVNERSQSFGRMGIARMIERAWRGCQAAIPGACPHAPAFRRLRPSG
jgi:hypothetical protein